MESRVWSAVLVHTYGRGFSFQVSIRWRMSVFRARTERCWPHLRSLGGQFGEPTLDEVDPAAGGWGEVQDEAGVLREPASDGRGLMVGGVVEHEVHPEFGRDGLVDRFEELQEFDRAVALVQRADDLARLVARSGVPGSIGNPRLRAQRHHQPLRRAQHLSARFDPALGSDFSHRPRARPPVRAG